MQKYKIISSITKVYGNPSITFLTALWGGLDFFFLIINLNRDPAHEEVTISSNDIEISDLCIWGEVHISEVYVFMVKYSTQKDAGVTLA